MYSGRDRVNKEMDNIRKVLAESVSVAIFDLWELEGQRGSVAGDLDSALPEGLCCLHSDKDDADAFGLPRDHVILHVHTHY